MAWTSAANDRVEASAASRCSSATASWVRSRVRSPWVYLPCVLPWVRAVLGGDEDEGPFVVVDEREWEDEEKDGEEEDEEELCTEAVS